MRERVTGPRDRQNQQRLTAREHKNGMLQRSSQKRADAAARPQPQKKYGKDDGEGVNRSAEQKRQQARPKNFCAEGRTARKGDDGVDEPAFSLSLWERAARQTQVWRAG